MYNADNTGLGQVTSELGTSELCAAMQKDLDKQKKCPYLDP